MNDQPAIAHAPAGDYVKPNIFIVGPSGSGKTTSLRNLDPERTLMIDTEQKALPFRGARKFRRRRSVTNLNEFLRVFEKALVADHADVLVIDSFTSIAEFAYASIVRPIERTGDAVMKAWTDYRDVLHDILIRSKASDKFVVFIGIDEQVQDDRQRLLSTISVQGSLKGKVEKEFVAVLWTKVIEADPLEGTGPRHVFVTNSDGTNKAKTPMDMFRELHIPNDLAGVLRRMDAYYLEDDTFPTGSPPPGADTAPPTSAYAA